MRKSEIIRKTAETDICPAAGALTAAEKAA